MDREAWCAEIHGVTKSRTLLRDWTELNYIVNDVVEFLIAKKKKKKKKENPLW